MNVDITVFFDGFHGDTSQTFFVGAVVSIVLQSPCLFDKSVVQDLPGVDLVNTTNLALKASIEACGPNIPFANIGRIIHEIASQRGYSVNSQLTGHGIGRVFHRPPWILHHSLFCNSFRKISLLSALSENDEPGVMLPGHVFTIEVRMPFTVGSSHST